MPTREFESYDLEQLIRRDEYVTEDGVFLKTLDGGETTDVPTGTDDLGIWCYLIFEAEGVSYRCWYIDGNSYWKSQCGQWEDTFPLPSRWNNPRNPERYIRKGDRITCEVVEKKEEVVVTTSWEPVAG